MSVSFQEVPTSDQSAQQAIPVEANPVFALSIQQPTTPADMAIETTHLIGNQVIRNTSNRWCSLGRVYCAASIAVLPLTPLVFYEAATSDTSDDRAVAIISGVLLLGINCLMLSIGRMFVNAEDNG